LIPHGLAVDIHRCHLAVERAFDHPVLPQADGRRLGEQHPPKVVEGVLGGEY
jgi:hypothetical protein